MEIKFSSWNFTITKIEIGLLRAMGNTLWRLTMIEIFLADDWSRWNFQTRVIDCEGCIYKLFARCLVGNSMAIFYRYRKFGRRFEVQNYFNINWKNLTLEENLLFWNFIRKKNLISLFGVLLASWVRKILHGWKIFGKLRTHKMKSYLVFFPLVPHDRNNLKGEKHFRPIGNSNHCKLHLTYPGAVLRIRGL